MTTLMAFQAAVRGRAVRQQQLAAKRNTAATQLQAWIRGVRSRMRRGVRFSISGPVGSHYGRDDAHLQRRGARRLTVFDRQRSLLASFRRALRRAPCPTFRSAFSVEFTDSSGLGVAIMKVGLALHWFAAESIC